MDGISSLGVVKDDYYTAASSTMSYTLPLIAGRTMTGSFFNVIVSLVKFVEQTLIVVLIESAAVAPSSG